MATISPVKIGNLALSHIGANSTIESLGESSTAAKQIDLWYDFSREQALTSFTWNFAKKRLLLALHADDAPTDDWLYRYQYPSDCLFARAIENPLGFTANAIPFTVENSDDGETKSILTNQEDAKLIYTFDLKDTNLFSPFFVEAFSYLLAHHICFALTGKLQLKQDLLGIYGSLLAAAPAQNANEGVDRGPRDTDWVRARDSSLTTSHGQSWDAFPDAEN